VWLAPQLEAFLGVIALFGSLPRFTQMLQDGGIYRENVCNASAAISNARRGQNRSDSGVA
jgi:hypothetical protein